MTVPISFISDHMEVIWDLDIEAAATAAGLGLGYARAATPGTHPKFVTALADMIEERQSGRGDRAHIGRYGAWPDSCPPDCCPAPVRPHHQGARP